MIATSIALLMMALFLAKCLRPNSRYDLGNFLIRRGCWLLASGIAEAAKNEAHAKSFAELLKKHAETFPGEGEKPTAGGWLTAELDSK